MPPLLITPDHLADPGLIGAVAAGQPVAIGDALLTAVQRRCEEARRALRDGQPVYGVNTGMGALSSVRLTEPQQRSHQRNLLLARADPLTRLTPREREVLGLMAEGRSNAAIAARIVVGQGAVEKHVTSIFGKLGLEESPEAHRRVLAVLRFLDA